MNVFQAPPNGITKVIPQVFTAGGTYTPTAGMVYARVQVQAGGGGSGGVAASDAGVQVFSGPGGGGEYSEGIVTAADVGASKAVTVGAGGTAGSSGNNAGGAGGASSLGTLVTANGGAAGTGGGASTSGVAGVGGSGGTGSLVVGQPGVNLVAAGFNTYLLPTGAGGDSFLGHGGTPSYCGAAGGYAGTNYGGGGGGVGSRNASTSAGAAGAPGIVRITEYCR